MWKILSCVNPDRDFHVHILESKTHQILTERFSSFLSSDSSFHELEKVTTLWLNLNLFCKNRVLSSVWFFVYIAIYQVFENSKSEYVREENKYARKFVRANISTNKVYESSACTSKVFRNDLTPTSNHFNSFFPGGLIKSTCLFPAYHCHLNLHSVPNQQ